VSLFAFVFLCIFLKECFKWLGERVRKVQGGESREAYGGEHNITNFSRDVEMHQ